MKHLVIISLLLVALLVMTSAMPADDEESTAKRESKEEKSEDMAEKEDHDDDDDADDDEKKKKDDDDDDDEKKKNDDDADDDADDDDGEKKTNDADSEDKKDKDKEEDSDNEDKKDKDKEDDSDNEDKKDKDKEEDSDNEDKKDEDKEEDSDNEDKKDKDKEEDSDNEDKKDEDKEDDGDNGDDSNKNDNNDGDDDSKKDDGSDDDNNTDAVAVAEGRSHHQKTHTSPMAKFSCKLSKSMFAHKPNSFVMSPFSVWHTLHLAYHGSAGDTKKQLKEALYAGQEEQEYKQIGADISHLNKVMSVMNKVYITNKNKLKKSTLKNILKDINPDQKSFEGSTDEALTELSDYILPVDFSSRSDVVDTINADVKEATKEAITEIITKKDLKKDTKMVLVNAIHFKGDWKTKFNKDETTKKDFHYSDGEENKTKKVDMMSMLSNELFNFGNDTKLGCTILELPYISSEGEKSQVSMFVYLPWEGVKLQDIIDKKSSKGKAPDFNEKKVYIQLPKFRMEVKLESDDLKKGLKDQGITDIFDEAKSDMPEFYVKSENLYVSKVIHKTMIEVNEEGTTAAGATAMALPPTRSGGNSAENFHCNRPFFFTIVDKKYNNPIFTGVFRNPNDVQRIKED